MEQPQSTPPEGDPGGPAWGERRRASAHDPPPPPPTEDDYDLYAGAGPEWSGPGGAPPPPPPRGGPDLSAVFVLLDALRRAAPAELQGRLTALIREALLTLRSLIDWYLGRLDNTPPEPRVEDIPID